MSNTNKTISVIIPIHELNDQTKSLLAESIGSVIAQISRPNELVLVVPKGSDAEKFVTDTYSNALEGATKIVSNDGKTDFSSQVNLGVEKASSEWVSILEMDDVYSRIWFKNVQEYITAYPSVELFLPIVVEVNNKGFAGLKNEPVWAHGFAEEMGILDHTTLLGYNDFNIDGSVFKKSIIEEHGGLKANLKLAFTYEFLLRLTYKDVKTMVIPKYGYQHLTGRDESLLVQTTKSMDTVEARWWVEMAKKESFFPNDRKLTYELIEE